MSNFARQQENQREAKEKNKNRRDKLAGYFFDLSKLIFAGLVIGGITPLFTHSTNNGMNWLTVVLGVFSTYIFALFAHRILK